MNHETKNYIKVASHEVKGDSIDKVVLLYSGGLDTSCMLKWLQDAYHAKVIALTIDIGQPMDDLDEIKHKALKLGAAKAIVLDCKDEFATEYVAKGIKANADYQGGYHLSTPLGRPLLAKKAVEVARQEGAAAIAHGATGKGNDQVRIESSALCFDPNIKIIAPVREWAMGRDEELAYARQHGIPTKQAHHGVSYSWDDNMWGVTGEGAEIEDPKLVPKYSDILQLCKTPEAAAETPETVTIGFKNGLPVALNGKKMPLGSLIAKLNTIGAKHAIGVATVIEDRLIGLKVRCVYEAPAAEVLVKAHHNLEKIVSTQTANEFKQTVDNKWAYLCYSAKWTDPAMGCLNAYIDKMNERVEGTVSLKLYKGIATAETIDSPYSLFDKDLATFDKNAKFNQNSSAGFIEIHTLAAKTHASLK
jgi:argininosuccinate synthase